MALALHVTPREVWEMDPKDLATLIDVMGERSGKR